MSKMIEIEHLSKSFDGRQAVEDLSMYVEKGALFAFLGPNGAGKSTTISMIAAQLPPDSGSIRVGGHQVGIDNDAIRRLIGIVFQDSLLDPLLTVEENLRLRAQLYGRSRQETERDLKWALEVAGAAELGKRRYGKLSGGQRRRADIARALAHRPQILILDEPTTGLDPQTRRHIWEMIRSLQHEEQLTVFLTTHYMEEAAAADYVVVMDAGRIRAQGTPSELRETYASDVLRLRVHRAAELEDMLVQGEYAYTIQGGVYVIRLGHTTDALPLLASCKDNIANLEIINATLDDVFIALTGSELINR